MEILLFVIGFALGWGAGRLGGGPSAPAAAEDGDAAFRVLQSYSAATAYGMGGEAK